MNSRNSRQAYPQHRRIRLCNGRGRWTLGGGKDVRSGFTFSALLTNGVDVIIGDVPAVEYKHSCSEGKSERDVFLELSPVDCRS